MRGLKTWAWAAVIAAATASPTFAQITSTTTSGTGTTGATSRTVTGTGGVTSGGTTTSSGLSGSGASGTGTNSGSTTITPDIINNLDSLQQQNMQFSNIGITAGSSMQKSNMLAGFYGNPTAMGLPTNAGAGAFGAPTFGATTGTGTVTGGRAGATGAAGQRGLTTNTQSGILIPLPVQIRYVAQMQFPTPPVATPKLQADLRGIINTGGLANPKGVEVVVTGTDVTLRGTVKDDGEARLAEGLVRLTPGVGNITNELSYPLASK